MWHETVSTHWADLSLWRRRARRERALTNRAWAMRAAERLPALVADAIQAVPGLAAMPPALATLAVGLAALGPEQADPPPAPLWEALLHISGVLDAPVQIAPNNPLLHYYADLLVAWGCGWNSMPIDGLGAWGRRWVMAVWALSGLVEGSVVRTVRYISTRIPPDDTEQLRDLLPQSGQEHELACAAREELADHISGKLIQGHCDCEHIICAQQHCLAAWVPDQRAPLRLFVARAIHGSVSSRPHAGALKERGILYRWLELHGVTINQVEFKICAGPMCRGQEITQAIYTGRKLSLSDLVGARPTKLRKRPPLRGIYIGQSCPICQRSDDPTQTYHIPRRNWIITPAYLGGSYHEEPRARCHNCGSLYPYPSVLDQMRIHIHELETKIKIGSVATTRFLRAELNDVRRRRKELAETHRCPLQNCGGEISQRQVLVWVRYDQATFDTEEQLLSMQPSDRAISQPTYQPIEVLVSPFVERPVLLIKLGLRYFHQHPDMLQPRAVTDTLWLQLTGFPGPTATHLSDAAAYQGLATWEVSPTVRDRDLCAWITQLRGWWPEQIAPELMRAHVAHGEALTERLRGTATPDDGKNNCITLDMVLVVPRPHP